MAKAKLFSVRFSVEAKSKPARAHHRAGLAQEGRRLAHMLDHLHRQHDIEVRAFGDERLGRRAAIIDVEARRCGVRFRHLDVARRGVDPVTAAPRRASGSARSPAPQPMSSDAKSAQTVARHSVRADAHRAENGGT